jgi:DNA-binding transcriptional LysR family regulator
VLPLLTVDEHDPNVAIIPIQPGPPPRRLGIAWHPDRRPPLTLSPFVEVAAEICRDLGEQWAASRAA